MANQIFVAFALLALVALPSAFGVECGDCEPLKVTNTKGATSTASGCFTVTCTPASGKAASIYDGIGATLADTVTANKEISFSVSCNAGKWEATVNGVTAAIDAIVCDSTSFQ